MNGFLFEVLAAEQRRRILFALVDHSSDDESPVSVDEPPDATGGDTTAHIKRYHVHLPKLDDYGFIEWDRRTNTVRPGNRFAEVRPILELCREREDELSVT
ncbi:DUF7344 domain-containing protein [Natrinema amylolyticum]|uniref:DUF7344 domain-containing protein n=1 Tax=Natrinema amylolyticum TaxID=2878679 RepID=UPI001CFBDF20|nr:hypothetical protein [Natrinema amylolyticum]